MRTLQYSGRLHLSSMYFAWYPNEIQMNYCRRFEVPTNSTSGPYEIQTYELHINHMHILHDINANFVSNFNEQVCQTISFKVHTVLTDSSQYAMSQSFITKFQGPSITLYCDLNHLWLSMAPPMTLVAQDIITNLIGQRLTNRSSLLTCYQNTALETTDAISFTRCYPSYRGELWFV